MSTGGEGGERSEARGDAVILVVDDDPSIFPLLEAVLEGEPADLITVESGSQALALLSGGLAPDLMLVDIMMPGMNGLETLGQARKLPGLDKVPAIFLTARSRSEDVVIGLEAGATDYVTKPFDLAELKARVRAALRLRELIVELDRVREAALGRERLKVMVETTGAVAHALNQPLTAALLKTETLLLRSSPMDPIRSDLEFLQGCLGKVADAVRRIRRITTYRTSAYLEDVRIVDLMEDQE